MDDDGDCGISKVRNGNTGLAAVHSPSAENDAIEEIRAMQRKEEKLPVMNRAIGAVPKARS